MVGATNHLPHFGGGPVTLALKDTMYEWQPGQYWEKYWRCTLEFAHFKWNEAIVREHESQHYLECWSIFMSKGLIIKCTYPESTFNDIAKGTSIRYPIYSYRVIALWSCMFISLIIKVAGRLTPYAREVIFKLSKWWLCLSKEVLWSCECYAHLHADPFISEPQISQR